MHASNANSTLTPQQRCQQQRASNYRNIAFHRGFEFGVVPSHGGAVNDQHSTFVDQSSRSVSLLDGGSARPELPNLFIDEKVRAGYSKTNIQL